MSSTLSLPERVCVVGDVHGDLDALINTAFVKARRNGLTHIIQVGDFWAYDQPGVLTKIDRQARINGIESLWFIDGNHENFTYLGGMVDSPNLHMLSDVVGYLGRGTRLNVGSRTAVAIGGAVSTDRFHPRRPRVEGKDWWPREAITEKDAELASTHGHADIIFSHDTFTAGVHAHSYAPRALDTITESAERDSRRNLDRVFRSVDPSLNIHGHFHDAHYVMAYGVKTVCMGRNTTSGFAGVLDSETLSVEFL